MSYLTPTLEPDQHAKAGLIIKKSEFIAFAYHVHRREQVHAYVTGLKDTFSDARHHCIGYIIGDPNNTTSAGFDDDGEPSGTAGKPILSVLQHKNIGNCAIIVVRYFGGIKLGAGGLTRAYARSAQAVINVLPLAKHKPMTSVRASCDFADESQVRFLVEKHGGITLDVTYTAQVDMTIEVPKAQLDKFTKDIAPIAVISASD